MSDCNFKDEDIKIAVLKVRAQYVEAWANEPNKTLMKNYSDEEWRLFGISYLMDKVENQNNKARESL